MNIFNFLFRRKEEIKTPDYLLPSEELALREWENMLDERDRLIHIQESEGEVKNLK